MSSYLSRFRRMARGSLELFRQLGLIIPLGFLLLRHDGSRQDRILASGKQLPA